MDNITLFEKKLNQIQVNLSDTQINQFMTYYEMLIEKNKVMNLTAITEFGEVIDKHFIDSLSINQVLSLNDIKTVIDVGTGAGFPGIPLKITFPHLKITLLDSLNKRVGFLNEVIDSLKLTDIEAIHGRAEDIGRNVNYREYFDLCVSRAVANLSTLSEYCMPFVKINGSFVSYKAAAVNEELESATKAIKILGGKIDHKETFTLPETDIERTFICVKKEKQTKKIYPRKAGTPTKEPLGTV